MLLLALPCQVKNIDCGAGICRNDFIDHQCDCIDGASNQNETASLPCDTNFCFEVNCINSVCENGLDDYTCNCNAGYKPREILTDDDKNVCIDIDECYEDETGDLCGEFGTCKNDVGGYSCDCNDGYWNMNSADSICVNTDECENGKDCGFGTCKDTEGSYDCECPEGTEQTDNSQPCTDIDECQLDTLPNFCSIGHSCQNLDFTFNCSCPSGISGPFYDNVTETTVGCGKYYFYSNRNNFIILFRFWNSRT